MLSKEIYGQRRSVWLLLFSQEYRSYLFSESVSDEIYFSFTMKRNSSLFALTQRKGNNNFTISDGSKGIGGFFERIEKPGQLEISTAIPTSGSH